MPDAHEITPDVQALHFERGATSTLRDPSRGTVVALRERMIASRRIEQSALLALFFLTACAHHGGEPPDPIDDGGVGRSRAALAASPITGHTLPPGYVSLTYDDGPGYSTLPIAAFLHNEGIPATFFVNGCRLDGHPPPGPGEACDGPTYPEDTLDTMIALGHRIANHTQDHAGLAARSVGERISGITVLQAVLDDHIEDELRLFRPPGNEWPADRPWFDGDERLRRILGPFEHTVPGSCVHDWDCIDPRPIDGGYTPPGDPASCARDLLGCAFPGSATRGIIQLHDRRPALIEADPRYRLNTYAYTRTFVGELRRRRYTFVPLDAIPGVLGPRRFDFATARHTSPEFSDSPAGWAPAIYSSSLRMGDIDGDGNLEICGRGNAGIRCVTFSAGRLQPARTRTPAFSNAAGFGDARYASTMMMGDVDRDGDDDVCMRGPRGVECVRGVGRGAPPATTSTLFIALTSATGWGDDERYWNSLRLVDVTGDGRADLCGRTAAGIVCSASRGDRFIEATRWSSELGAGSPYAADLYSSTLSFGDVDGDGRPDACFRARAGMRCALHRGAYFASSSIWTQGPFSDLDRWTTPGTYGSIRLVDVDGDGDADVCGRATTGVVCAFSNGNTFRPYQYLVNERMRESDGWGEPRYGATLLFGDLDRDGVADVCGRSAGGLDCALGTEALAAR